MVHVYSTFGIPHKLRRSEAYTSRHQVVRIAEERKPLVHRRDLAGLGAADLAIPERYLHDSDRQIEPLVCAKIGDTF